MPALRYPKLFCTFLRVEQNPTNDNSYLECKIFIITQGVSIEPSPIRVLKRNAALIQPELLCHEILSSEGGGLYKTRHNNWTGFSSLATIQIWSQPTKSCLNTKDRQPSAKKVTFVTCPTYRNIVLILLIRLIITEDNFDPATIGLETNPSIVR